MGGEPAPLRLVGDFAFVPSCGPAPVELRYALPRRTSRERVGKMEVEYHWRGDEIVGVTPQSDFLSDVSGGVSGPQRSSAKATRRPSFSSSIFTPEREPT